MSTRYNLNRLAHFVATVERGTITAAAAHLGVSKTVVSKQLQSLEEEVGTSLLLRNTRRIQLTEAGRALYDEAKPALLQMTNAFETIMERDTAPRGRLRITAPVDYGLLHVAPLVTRYREMYPAVEADLHLNDELIDMVEARFDVAFRVGWLKDSSNLARKLQNFEEIAVCSPETLGRSPVEQPQDLASLPFIQNQAFAGRSNWTFSLDDKTKTVGLRVVSTMNITLAIRSAILHGNGFAIMPDFLVKDDLATGALVRILPEWTLRSGGIYTVTSPSRVRANALHAFLAMAHGEPWPSN